eukprot:539401_1
MYMQRIQYECSKRYPVSRKRRKQNMNNATSVHSNNKSKSTLCSSSFAISETHEHKDEEKTKWIPDHKHKHCTQCSLAFSIINRRHHCRKCGTLVCANCSPQKWRMKGGQYERVCNTCFDTLRNNR